ncbi:MAG: hypothetical protein ACI3VA_11170 [Candidatus Limivicinus sp.]
MASPHQPVEKHLADGCNDFKTMRLFRKLPENPGMPELPLNEEVEY